MIGLNFNVKNEYGNPLVRIFENVDIRQYFWNNEFSEVYNCKQSELTAEKILCKDILTGEEFNQEIAKRTYYMIFLTIVAFKNKEEVVEINNYNDFINSKCEITFICSDTEYISIYCKDEKILKQILVNCQKNKFENIEIVTKENNKMFSFI